VITGPREVVKRAKKLRSELSLPEGLLWQELRKRDFDGSTGRLCARRSTFALHVTLLAIAHCGPHSSEDGYHERIVETLFSANSRAPPSCGWSTGEEL
jgi:hypothetical protein